MTSETHHTTKQCKTCGDVKLLSEFHKSASCKLGVLPRCKTCVNKGPQPPITTDEVISRFTSTHGDRYDYSQVTYIHSKHPVTIICKAHGEFEQRPDNHTSGRDCPMCRAIINNKANGERIRNYYKRRRDNLVGPPRPSLHVIINNNFRGPPKPTRMDQQSKGRTCTRCNTWKEWGKFEFRKTHGREGHYRSTCKTCRNANNQYRRITPMWANHVKTRAVYIEREKQIEAIGCDPMDIQVDHIVPRNGWINGVRLVCGLHWHRNLTVTGGMVNALKGGIEWPDMWDYTDAHIAELNSHIDEA